MANSYPYIAPSLVGIPGVQAFNQKTYPLAQGAIFRQGDLLVRATTGTITVPNPNGSIAAVVPTAAAVVSLSSSSGAPQEILYGYYTYIGASSIESLPSQEFFVIVPAGNSATVTVPSAGAPGAATDFALYLGLLSGSEVQQVASTALDSPATVPNPLTNYAGANRGATNLSSNILGMALDDYDRNYQNGPAANQTTVRALFGADQTAPPVGFNEQYSAYICKLQNQPIEMSLVQAYYPSLVGQAVGVLYSTAYGTFAADTSQSNKVGAILGKAQGATNPNYDSVGGTGDTGARVIVQFTSGLI